MQSAMFVCFACKKSRRYRAAAPRNPTCQACKSPMVYVFHKFEMPKQEDRKGWQEFAAKVGSYNSELAERSVANVSKNIRQLEAKLKKLLPTNRKQIIEIEALLASNKKWLEYWEQFAAATRTILKPAARKAK